MATMKQVAERAGVSTSTVSHVINNTRVVSEDVRERVLAVIAEMRYVPSAVARSLKNDKTHIIGVMVPNSANPYCAELIQRIEDAAFKLGYNIILCNAYDDVAKQASYLRVLMERRIDGLIFIGCAADGEVPQLLCDMAMPKVMAERDVPGVVADFVAADHERGGYLATRHLLELGHRAIACVAGPAHLPPSRARVLGYRRALDEAGVPFVSHFLLHADFTSEGGCTALRHLLALPERPSAVFAANDLMAIGAICAASEAGIRVPDQLSVIGYDDIALASHSTPRLTTMAQPKQQMGEAIARLLVERILGTQTPPRREMFLPVLVERQSTARLA
jgi:LacI family transcriptional regulator